MEIIRFTSVLNPDKYGYVFEPDSTAHWDVCYRTANVLSYHSFYFETFGDGRTAHTPLAPVSSLEMQLDWMLSLAQYLTGHPEAYGSALSGLFGYGMPRHETAQFLASLKEPKETDSTVYYSVAEQKVSKSETKRHDKRWFTLPSSAFRLSYDIDRYVSLWNNGQETRSLKTIEWLGLYFALGDALNRSVSFSASDSMQKWTNEDVVQSARVLRETILALEAQENAKRSVECVIGNHLRAKQASPAQIAA